MSLVCELGCAKHVRSVQIDNFYRATAFSHYSCQKHTAVLWRNDLNTQKICFSPKIRHSDRLDLFGTHSWSHSGNSLRATGRFCKSAPTITMITPLPLPQCPPGFDDPTFSRDHGQAILWNCILRDLQQSTYNQKAKSWMMSLDVASEETSISSGNRESFIVLRISAIYLQ